MTHTHFMALCGALRLFFVFHGLTIRVCFGNGFLRCFHELISFNWAHCFVLSVWAIIFSMIDCIVVHLGWLIVLKCLLCALLSFNIHNSIIFLEWFCFAGHLFIALELWTRFPQERVVTRSFEYRRAQTPVDEGCQVGNSLLIDQKINGVIDLTMNDACPKEFLKCLSPPVKMEKTPQTPAQQHMSTSRRSH